MSGLNCCLCLCHHTNADFSKQSLYIFWISVVKGIFSHCSQWRYYSGTKHSMPSFTRLFSRNFQLKCADALSDNTIDTGPLLCRVWRPGEVTHSKSVWKTTESSRCFWNWHVHLYVHVCHLVRDAYCDWKSCIFFFFLHIPPVLANCRQSYMGKFRSKRSCFMCRLNA